MWQEYSCKYDCNRLFNNDDNIIYYLAPVNISPINFFYNIREHDSDKDWTYKLTDEELLECTISMIEKGKKIKEECKKYNISFVDTSHNRKEILESILADIEQKIK